MKDLEAFITKLLADIAALPEHKMRTDLLARRLKALDPDDAAISIDSIYKKGSEDALAKAAQMVLIDNHSLQTSLGVERYHLIYYASIRLGLTKVTRLFTELKPKKSGLAGYDKEEEIKMELITLGERRILSKKPVKDTIDRLLSDPDPMVVTNLLNNPKITEKEVLKIVSKRPNSPVILKLVVGHRVWSKRYEVIKAVVLNPYTPPRLSISLLEFLMTQDVRLVSEDNTIHAEVKLHAVEVLEKRRG